MLGIINAIEHIKLIIMHNSHDYFIHSNRDIPIKTTVGRYIIFQFKY